MGDSLWMSVANQNSASHDSRLLSALKHLTGSDSESAPIPEQLLPSLVSKLIGNELGTSALFRLVPIPSAQTLSNLIGQDDACWLRANQKCRVSRESGCPPPGGVPARREVGLPAGVLGGSSAPAA